MKEMFPGTAVLLLLATLNFPLSTGHAQGTAFSYQGRLTCGVTPVNGSYDVAFALFATNVTGTSVAGPVTNAAVGVTNGLFTTVVDFGQVFNGVNNWLELAVSTNGANSFSTLAPRQQLTPAPYAIFANSASNVLGTISAAQLSGSIPAAVISGTIPLAQLPANVITNGASGVNLSGMFSGNGAGVTNINLNAIGSIVATNINGWGDNFYGETSIPAGLTNVTSIAAGWDWGLALKSDGTVAGWGDNDAGQTSIPAGLNQVAAIAAGDTHGIALKSDGTVIGWGDNNAGQTSIPAGLTRVVAIAAGAEHNLALKSDGTVVGWGDNIYGEISIPAGLTNVTAIAAGGGHSLALKSDGTIIGWGDNGGGETTIPAGLTQVVAIAAGGYHNMALKSDGTVAAWGDGGYGQTTVPAGLTQVTAIAAGVYDSLALKSDGTIVGWGDNSSGQTSIPAGLTGVTAIAAGLEFSLALDNLVATPAAEVNGTVTATAFVGDGSGLTFPITLATNLINAPGPLPLSNSFTSHGGTLVINTSGSGTINSVTAMGMIVSLDGASIETNKIWCNVTSAHMAFVPKTILRTGVAAGTHILTLSSWSNTISDPNDNFNVTIQELPY
jgi:hypothetical protein